MDGDRASRRSPGVERPAPPFTTSTLTQEASRKLGFSTERTMQVAQRLFQGDRNGDGRPHHYHRTDSTTLSDKALAESARVIREMFGGEYYAGAAPLRDEGEERAGSARGDPPDRLPPRRRSRSKASLDRDELRLYELIWKRTMASQMVDARVLRTTIEITGDGANGETGGVHRARQGDRVRRLPPRLRRRQRRSGRRARRAGNDAAEAARSGDRVDRRRRRATARCSALEPKRHETTPPARFTEASLIKELERLGIGRPSTYAPTIGTIERRGYVFRQGKALVPSFTAFAVTRLLREHFGDLVDVEFTAEMEEDLDEISRGEREWLDFIREFYRGDKQHRGLEDAVEQARRDGRLPADRRRRRSRVAASRSASASGGTARSSSSAKAARARRRRCRRRSRRRISRVDKAIDAAPRQGRGAAPARRRSGDRA